MGKAEAKVYKVLTVEGNQNWRKSKFGLNKMTYEDLVLASDEVGEGEHRISVGGGEFLVINDGNEVRVDFSGLNDELARCLTVEDPNDPGEYVSARELLGRGVNEVRVSLDTDQLDGGLVEMEDIFWVDFSTKDEDGVGEQYFTLMFALMREAPVLGLNALREHIDKLMAQSPIKEE